MFPNVTASAAFNTEGGDYPNSDANTMRPDLRRCEANACSSGAGAKREFGLLHQHAEMQQQQAKRESTSNSLRWERGIGCSCVDMAEEGIAAATSSSKAKAQVGTDRTGHAIVKCDQKDPIVRT